MYNASLCIYTYCKYHTAYNHASHEIAFFSLSMPWSRILWDMTMLLVLSLNIVFLPVAISFFREFINPGWLSFTCFSDVFFITDIVLNFWTGVITEDNIVLLNLKTIRRSYVKRWLAFDILSVIPLDYMAIIVIETRSGSSTLLHASTALRFLRLFKLLSLLRLFRVVKLMHYLAKWEEVNNKVM